MRPEFYEKTIERQDFFVSLIGEVGLAKCMFTSIYVLRGEAFSNSRGDEKHTPPNPSHLGCQVGGAYGIVSTVFFGLYILLWNLEFGYNHREDIANSLGHHEAKAEAKALTEVRLEVPVEKPEKVPDKLPEKVPGLPEEWLFRVLSVS